MTIKIQNPLPGGRVSASFKQAQKYVKAGRADIVRGVLVFRGEHHGHQAASQHHTCGLYDRSVRLGAIATDKQLAGVPIVKPREMIAPRGRLIPRPKYMRASDVNHVPTPQRASA